MNDYPEKAKSLHGGYRASTVGERESLSRKIKGSYLVDSCSRIANEKLSTKEDHSEILPICPAVLLLVLVLLLSCHGIRNGRTEYSILRNGQIIEGHMHKAVLTLSLGFTLPYCALSFVITGMLVYSLISKKPVWSLPLIILYLAELFCDVGDAIVATCLFFYNFPLTTALFYATGTLLLISAEIWIWLGVLRLYECRTFA